MAQRIRKFATQKAMEDALDDFVTQGYKITSRGEQSAAVVKKGKKEQHALVFLLTFWFTLGFGNLIYAIIPSKVEDEILLRIEKES